MESVESTMMATFEGRGGPPRMDAVAIAAIFMLDFPTRLTRYNGTDASCRTWIAFACMPAPLPAFTVTHACPLAWSVLRHCSRGKPEDMVAFPSRALVFNPPLTAL